jgi:hypothetical protein
MSAWQIKAYWLPGGTCPIQDWYRAQDVLVQAEFDASLGTLTATIDWTDTKSFGVLKRAHLGLGEIRFMLEGPEKRRFRPVGIWPPIVEGEFILLVGCEKSRNGVLIPDNAFALALEYKRRFEAGEGRIDDYV